MESRIIQRTQAREQTNFFGELKERDGVEGEGELNWIG